FFSESYKSLLGNAQQHAGKKHKAGGSSKNPPGRPRGKHRGIRKWDGTYVTRGTMIYTQLPIKCHPGLNVGIGRDRTLYALEHGKVLMTTEKVNPNWDNKFVKRFYADFKDRDVPLYKTYFHVIPEPQKNVFRLVGQI
ncbi:unnamed protein product, partial [Meganyctiphanes norvegica]